MFQSFSAQNNLIMPTTHVCRAVTGFAGPWMLWIMDDTKCKLYELLMRQSFSAQYNLIMPTAPVCRMVMGSVSPWMWMILNVDLFELLLCQLIMPTAHVCRVVMGSASPWMWMILNVDLSELLMCQFNYVNCACAQGGNGVCKQGWAPRSFPF